jgi:hypothetical protein
MITYVRKCNVILEMAHAWVACLINVAEPRRATGRPIVAYAQWQPAISSLLLI